MNKHAVIIALITCMARSAWADPAAELAALEAREPALDQVKQAALRYAGLAGRGEASWTHRARLAGSLPDVTITIDRGSGNARDVSRSSTGTERLDVGFDRDLGIEARAVWHLDRLIFSDVELRAARAAQQQHGERGRLLAQVTVLFFQRRKLQIAAIWSPEKDPGKAALQKLAIDEMTAQLDDITGGAFSRALQPPGPVPSRGKGPGRWTTELRGEDRMVTME